MNAEDVVADIKSKITDKKRKRYSGANARRSVKRPEEILRDVRGLKLRQRVSLVLGDEILREELEDSIKNSSVNGVTKLDTIRAYQDILLPALQPNLIGIGKGFGGSTSTVLPINDIRGETTAEFSKTERSLRCKLAAVYRLVDVFGWSETIFNHISVQPNPEKNEFLLNPFGLLMSEVTAASLVKVDLDGNVIHGGSTDLGINKAGFILHSTIHSGRPDISCIIHIHTSDAVAVSSMKCGFLRISQESLIVGGVSYHDYCGILIDEGEKESIIKDLGPENMVMFLRNHGIVVCGKSIEDAFALLMTVLTACESQVKAVAVGLENLNIISDEAYAQVQETMKQASSKTIKGGGKRGMTLTEYQFEAHMRWMDSQGYRTGYVYHMPDIFISGKTTKKVPECRVPPNVMSDVTPPHQVYYNYHGPDSISPHLKPQSMGRGNTHRARLKWLNSPVIGTQYVKEETQIYKSEPVPLEFPDETGEEEPTKDKIVENGLTNGNLVNGDVHGDEGENEKKVSIEVSEAETVVETVTVDETAPTVETVVIEETTPTVETVIIEETAPTVETEPVVNGNSVSNDSSDEVIDNNLLSPTESPSKSNNNTQSSNSLNVTSDNDGTPEGNNEDGTKPQKVKKQKSFKKSLMKKFNKKDETK